MQEEHRCSTDRLYGIFYGNVFGSFSSLRDDVDMTRLPDDMLSNPQIKQPFGSLDVIMPWYCCDYCEILT
ncbi:hypothetical protein Hanom_Chr16g01423901 [Helianthus anomalus]